MIGLVQLAVIPMLMAATIGAVLRQDLRRLARIWAVGLPVAALAGVASAQLAAWALTVTDSMCSVIGDGKTQLVDQLGKSLPHTLGRAPDFVQMIILLLHIAGTLLVWLELLLRASAVYIAMSFMPLALACYIWPAAAGIAKRTVELVLALILSKFVIVAGLILGLADLTSPGPVDNVLSAGAILMIAGFAPFCLLRLAPIVETAAIAHMEGLSRRPFRAATRTVSAGVGLATNPVGRAVLAGVTSRGGPSQPSAVAPEPLPERPAAFVTSGAGGHGAQ
jgi:hypothetical protein